MNLNARLFDRTHFFVEDIFRKAIVRNSVAKHAARLFEALVNIDLMPKPCQVVRGRKTRRAGPYDGDSLAGRSETACIARTKGVVHRVALQAADVHGVVHHGPPTRVLARMLADVRAGGRKRVVFSDKLDRIVEAACGRKGDIARNVHMGRTRHHAGHPLRRAAQAAAMLHMLLEVFAKCADAYQDLLGGLISNRAIGTDANMLRELLEIFKSSLVRASVDNLLEHVGNARKADAARDALSAALGMGYAYMRTRHIHGTRSSRGCAKTARRRPALPAHCREQSRLRRRVRYAHEASWMSTIGRSSPPVRFRSHSADPKS